LHLDLLRKKIKVEVLEEGPAVILAVFHLVLLATGDRVAVFLLILLKEGLRLEVRGRRIEFLVGLVCLDGGVGRVGLLGLHDEAELLFKLEKGGFSGSEFRGLLGEDRRELLATFKLLGI